jgi:hypothetical protein
MPIVAARPAIGTTTSAFAPEQIAHFTPRNTIDAPRRGDRRRT